MEFNESLPPLVGYLERDDSAMEMWYEILDQKIPLRLKSKNASWSLRIRSEEDGADPTFSLVLGFRSYKSSSWKPLDTIKVIDIHVKGDHVFLDVVNTEADNALGCIVMRPEDCTGFDPTWMMTTAKDLEWPFSLVTETFIESKLKLFRGNNLDMCRDLADFVRKGYSVRARGLVEAHDRIQKRKAELSMATDQAEGSTDQSSKSQKGSVPNYNRDGIVACLNFPGRSLRIDSRATADAINVSRLVVNPHSLMYLGGRLDSNAIHCRLFRSCR